MQIQKKPQSHKRNRTEKRFLKTINQQELLVQLSDTNIGSDSKETPQGEEGRRRGRKGSLFPVPEQMKRICFDVIKR